MLVKWATGLPVNVQQYQYRADATEQHRYDVAPVQLRRDMFKWL